MKGLRGQEKGMLISQPGYLGLLHHECRRYPGFRLDFGATVVTAIREGDRVAALKTRARGVEEDVAGDVFVACNGRHSVLRRVEGVVVESFEQPANALWLRFDFSDHEELLPSTVDVHMFGRGVVRHEAARRSARGVHHHRHYGVAPGQPQECRQR